MKNRKTVHFNDSVISYLHQQNYLKIFTEIHRISPISSLRYLKHKSQIESKKIMMNFIRIALSKHCDKEIVSYGDFIGLFIWNFNSHKFAGSLLLIQELSGFKSDWMVFFFEIIAINCDNKNGWIVLKSKCINFEFFSKMITDFKQLRNN